MPQPIRSVDYVYVDFGPHAVRQRPTLAANIPVISGIWNETETRFGLFLATLLGADAATGIAMFNAITNDGARRAAMDAVCRLKLDNTQRADLQVVHQALSARYQDRNKVIHGAWGISTTYPDHLLWADSKDAVVFHVDMMALKDSHNDERYARVMSYQSSIFTYDQRDFDAIIERMDAAYQQLFQFSEPFIERAYGSSAVVLPMPPTKPLPRKPANR